MKTISVEIQEEIKKLRLKGKSHREIGKFLHVAPGTALVYSKEIYITPTQHRNLILKTYKKGLGKLTKEERHRASLKGGLNNRKNLIPKYTKDQLLRVLKDFYNQNNRIPTKRDFVPTYGAFIRIFHTWNNAIIEAGFSPNPVLFAKKYIANDGHKCDSLAEKIIDDWLTSRHINHIKNARYDKTKFTADFKIGETFIEFFGLHGQLKSYDRLMKNKLRYIHMHKYKLIALHPNDIFPKSKLDQKLNTLRI